MTSLTSTAEDIGRRNVLCDVNLFAAWIDLQEDVRTWADGFGPISTPELFRYFVLDVNNTATAEQRVAACEEIKRRYLDDESESVRQHALRAMEPA